VSRGRAADAAGLDRCRDCNLSALLCAAASVHVAAARSPSVLRVAGSSST
jgi:hypothetical protein